MCSGRVYLHNSLVITEVLLSLRYNSVPIVVVRAKLLSRCGQNSVWSV